MAFSRLLAVSLLTRLFLSHRVSRAFNCSICWQLRACVNCQLCNRSQVYCGSRERIGLEIFSLCERINIRLCFLFTLILYERNRLIDANQNI